MNFSDYADYQNCENTYTGYIEHFDAVTNIQLVNQALPMEKASVQIMAAYLSSTEKWGLFNGLSTRPMMPIAIKMLFSRQKQKETPELIERLKMQKLDLKTLRQYNMLCVLS